VVPSGLFYTQRPAGGEWCSVRVFSAAYLATLGITVASAVVLCGAGRLRPGAWVVWANRALALVLLAVTVAWFVQTDSRSTWTAGTSLPLALCDLTTLVASAALLTRWPLLVELTYFWGLAGALQSLLTPDLQSPFPSLTFFEYVVAHAGIVCAALFLVVGQRLAPRPHAVPRIMAVTIGYTAIVGLVDALTGGDYMYLRQPPGEWTLLKVLGPWPWYIASATLVAVVLVTALDAPFWSGRRHRPVAPSPPATTLA
jgi:hypothetical integral membrane protein (TIGR02206 family)